ncbi:MAG: UvrD-helicase domain-containing protein [Candidatus Spyradocola sp.]|jgi:uncharacterized protein (TIGR00375 family)
MTLADLHIHSRYARATSRDGDTPHLDLWARYKGLGIVGTGDFTHPGWRKELRETLVPAEEGLYRLRDDLRLPAEVEAEEPRFVLSGEISTIYKRGGKTRKVHHVILLPGLDEAEALAQRLEAIGNLHSDGRPILGLDSRDLLEIVLETCPEAVYIPAHVWTPHFSLFGAFSGFDTVEECFGDLTPYVHALETGLSSDPPMNRRWSALDRFQLVSNSDAHSPNKLGREANILSCARTYPALKRAIETGEGLEGTVEFFPEEGKYHFDGHRACGCCLEPSRALELNNLCPVCGKRVTIGVAHRVEELADRPEGGEVLGKAFESLLPLPELLGDVLGASAASKRVQAAYFSLLRKLGPEFRILRELSVEEMERTAGPVAAEALRRLRAGRVRRAPGYDGEYGRITLFAPHELEVLGGQTMLFSLGQGEGLARRKAPAKSASRAASPADAAKGEPAPAPAAPAGLNARQEEAVAAQEAAVAVVAGPGTGKTHTLVARIVHEIEQEKVPTKEITAVTFTRQAAEELRARLAEALGGRQAVRNLTVGTFHAVCLAHLPPKQLLGRAEVVRVLAELLRERGETSLTAAECQRRISAQKNGLEAELPEGLREAYDARLAEAGARDLDDVLLEGLEIQAPAFQNLLVDEFQDVNPVQRELVLRWSRGGRSLFVIGDPDQSIYGFRGASAAGFAELGAHGNLRTLRLTENYRSAPAVLEAAKAVIAHNGGPERELHAHRGAGAPVRVVTAPDAFSEGVWIAKEIGRLVGGVGMLEAQQAGAPESVRAFSEIAVLCRTHRQLEQIEVCLRHDGIPCEVFGRGAFLEDAAVQGAVGLLRGLTHPQEAETLRAAVQALWGVSEGAAWAAAAAVGGPAEEGSASERLERAAGAFPELAAVALAVRAVEPLLRSRPRRALDALAEALGRQDDENFLRLRQTAALFARMEDFLAALLLGEEADVRRMAGVQAASGAVKLMTLHAAKGLEFPVVILAGATEGELPLDRPGRRADVQEERRLLFVGMTRAREELILTCGGAPSPFLAELPADVRRESARAVRREPKPEQLSLF